MGIPGPRDYNGGVTVIGYIDRARPAVVYGWLAVLLAAVFVPMSLFGLVDGDEGTYLLVSRLVIEGQLPYHDFYYPQMFLLPYVYGAWMTLVGYSWYGARLLSAFFSVALGLLLYRQAARRSAALPAGFFFRLGPATFVFNVVGSQTIRADYSLMDWWAQKTMAPKTLLGLGLAEGVISLQFILLFVVSVASWVSCALSRERLPLASAIAVLLTLASLVPTPAYTQYFCMPLPFLLADAVVFCAALTRESPAPRLRYLLASMAVVYLSVSPLDLYRYTISGAMVSGILPGESPANWPLSTIRAVGAAIDREVRPNRPLAISLWPGYFVETQASILPGMENHFALMFSRRVTPRELDRFKLMSYPALFCHLEHHTVDVVVLGNWTSWTESPELLRDRLLKNGYTLKERIAHAEIYTLQLDGRR